MSHGAFFRHKSIHTCVFGEVVLLKTYDNIYCYTSSIENYENNIHSDDKWFDARGHRKVFKEYINIIHLRSNVFLMQFISFASSH